MEDNHNPLNVSIDDAKEILDDLASFRKTKLFAHIAAKRLVRMNENFQLILEGDITTAGLRAEREALIGETRLWRDFIREISEYVEVEMNAVLEEEEDQTTINDQPL